MIQNRIEKTHFMERHSEGKMEIVYRAPLMKGIYRKGSKQDCPDGFFYDVRNGLILPSGVQKREGFTSPAHARWTGLSSNLVGKFDIDIFMFTERLTVPQTNYIVVLKKIGTTLWLTATHETISNTITISDQNAGEYDADSSLISTVEYQGKLYIRTNSSKFIWTWSYGILLAPTNISAIAPRGAWDLIERRDRLYLGGNGSSAVVPNNAIYYTNSSSESPYVPTFATANTIALPPGRDLEQVRIFNWSDDMLILTTKYPIIMRGTTATGVDAATFGEFRNEPGMTPIYPRCAVLGTLGCYYLGHNALYRFNGQYSLDLTTNVLQDVITDVFARSSKAFMWYHSPYIVLSYWADDDGDSVFDTGEMHHWLYDEIEQKWAGRFTTVGYNFIAATSNSKIGPKFLGSSYHKVTAYLFDYTFSRIFYYPDPGIYTDTKETTTTDYKHIIEIPSRDFGLCHKYKDLKNVHIGAKVVAGTGTVESPSGIDAVLSVEETNFPVDVITNNILYNANSLYIKKIEIKTSGPKEGDKDDATVTRNAFVDFPWLMPHDATYDATGKRFGLQLFQHNPYNCLTKYITMEAELSQAEQHPSIDKESKKGGGK